MCRCGRTAALPHALPAHQNEPLDAAGTASAFAALTASINEAEAAAGKPLKSVDEVAMGFVRVANEAMCRPIRCALAWRPPGGCCIR